MNVAELIELLEAHPANARVSVSLAPGEVADVTGITGHLEQDAGEICNECEVTLLAGPEWESVDLDAIDPDASVHL
jgi:hypothetical protein